MSGNWQAGGFAARGHRHVLKDQPCQDAIRVGSRRFAHGEALVLSVADGHGSARHAEIGAQLAVDAAADRLLDFYTVLLPELHAGLDAGPRLNRVLELALAPTRRQLVQDWSARVAAHAAAEPELELLRHYGTTLIFVLAVPELVLFGQLGDGDLLLVDAEGHVSRPLPKDPHSFADETSSLCQHEAWLQMRLSIQPPPTGPCLLLLSTDGYANSYESDATFAGIGPDYLNLVREHGLQKVEGFLPTFLEQVSRGGSGDDVTLGLAYFSPANAQEPSATVEEPSAHPPFGDEPPGCSEEHHPSASAVGAADRTESACPEESGGSRATIFTSGRSSRCPDM